MSEAVMQTERLTFATEGNADMVDVTGGVADAVVRAGLEEGQALVFVVGSTAAVTTIEFEPGLRRDLPEMLDRIAAVGAPYHHDQTWHDGNGPSHLRASLLGPSLVVPVECGRLLLGTWQQIVLVDLDARPRRRELVVQLSGRGVVG